MISQGFKNYLKSISLGNLSSIDDNSIDAEVSPLSAHPHYRSDKHNLSSINEQKRELLQRLKEFSELTHQIYEIDIELPHDIPERNLGKLQGTVSKEIYQQQSAMWELLVTEQNFLKQIQFIVEVYISVFERLTNDFFPKVNASDIFSNLKEVYRVSLEFWKECMHPLVKQLTYPQYLLQSHLLKDGFIKIGQILEPYILYCTEISKCRNYILTLEKGDELFSEYTKWAMEFEESNREMLCDHLAKPFQRLTKYKILLQAIQKYSGPNEKTDIQDMIEAVDVFVTRVNEKVEEKTLSRRISVLANQIDSYDVIDPIGDDILSIVNQFNKFDLTAKISIGGRKVIRQLAHSGEMKLREGPSKTIDVRLYLLTDILLITKPKKKTFGKMKIIKSPVILDKVRFQKISNNAFACICLNEFNCLSSFYHFCNSDPKKVDEWLQKLEEAVKNYQNLKQSITDTTVSRDFPNSIPKVMVVQSSPQQSRLKSQSSTENAENNIVVEWSFKRKSPVERKHKHRKDSIAHGVPLSTDSPLRERKNSQPVVSISEKNGVPRLSKSNSFHERGKQEIVKQMADNSDIDSSSLVSDAVSSTQNLNKFCQNDFSEKIINDVSDNVDNNSEFSGNFITESVTIHKNFSKSLNKLNY